MILYTVKNKHEGLGKVCKQSISDAGSHNVCVGITVDFSKTMGRLKVI